MGYTHQDPSEIAAVVLAAAIAEGYEGPVFIQGDHFQANAKKFATDAEGETKALERAATAGKKRPKGDTATAAESTDTSAEGDDQREKRVDGVYVIRDGRAQFVPVKTGISDDRFVEVVEGLAAEDKVITGPYQTLRTLESGKKVQEKKDTKPEERSR